MNGYDLTFGDMLTFKSAHFDGETPPQAKLIISEFSNLAEQIDAHPENYKVSFYVYVEDDSIPEEEHGHWVQEQHQILISDMTKEVDPDSPEGYVYTYDLSNLVDYVMEYDSRNGIQLYLYDAVGDNWYAQSRANMTAVLLGLNILNFRIGEEEVM